MRSGNVGDGFVPWLVAACIGFAFQVAGPAGGRDCLPAPSAEPVAAPASRQATAHAADRLLFVWLYRLVPSLVNAAVIIQPDTIVRWHRAGFRFYWRWKSRSRGGRPKVAAEVRSLIRRMSLENSLWGAPRIHGELLKLGIEVAQSTVAKYMAKRCGPGRARRGRPSCAIMWPVSVPWTFLWFRRSIFGCCSSWSSCGTNGDD